jgi:DNA-binding NarL/FixJ family response regulator
MESVLHVLIFDDVVAARGETFRIPGLEVTVMAHADDAVLAIRESERPPDVVFMDHAMGRGRKSGTQAIEELRAAGYAGRIVAISSDPAANAEMRKAGADEALGQKAQLRSFLVHLGETAQAPPP